jgi:hypothetical protein
LGVAVHGDYAFVADREAGLQVINVSDRQAPWIATTVDLPDSAYDVALDGNHAYVADHRASLQIVDVTEPLLPLVVGGLLSIGSARGVTVEGSLAYVTDADWGGMLIVDVSQPTIPEVVGSVETPDLAYGVSVIGSTAYIAGHLSGLQVVDVSVATAPRLVGSVGTSDRAWDVASDGAYIYIADGQGGLTVAPPHCEDTEGVLDPAAFRPPPGSLVASPNPGGGPIRLEFDLPRRGAARLLVYDLHGRQLRSLFDHDADEGHRSLIWDGRDDCGRRVASGVYLVRLDWEGGTQTGRVTLLR